MNPNFPFTLGRFFALIVLIVVFIFAVLGEMTVTQALLFSGLALAIITL